MKKLVTGIGLSFIFIASNVWSVNCGGKQYGTCPSGKYCVGTGSSHSCQTYSCGSNNGIEKGTCPSDKACVSKPRNDQRNVYSCEKVQT